MDVLMDPQVSLSVRHMHAGMAALDHGEWQSALHHFNEAIRLRQAPPWRGDAQSAWLFAAAWINRSDALRRMNKPTLLPDALRSLDRAIAAMRYVPLADHPAFPERLVLAWINRATICGEMRDFSAALEGFAMAESILETWGRATTSARRFLASMLSTNRARTLLETGEVVSAWENASAAAEDLIGVNAPSALSKARAIQCHALALLLDEPDGPDLPGDWIAAATDATEEALVLVRSIGCADSWVTDLVRYGARIYRICQPRFLAEFLTEWLIDGPLALDANLRRDMRHELLLAQAELEHRVLHAPQDTTHVESQIRILKSLQTASRRLSSPP